MSFADVIGDGRATPWKEQRCRSGGGFRQREVLPSTGAKQFVEEVEEDAGAKSNGEVDVNTGAGLDVVDCSDGMDGGVRVCTQVHAHESCAGKGDEGVVEDRASTLLDAVKDDVEVIHDAAIGVKLPVELLVLEAGKECSFQGEWTE